MTGRIPGGPVGAATEVREPPVGRGFDARSRWRLLGVALGLGAIGAVALAQVVAGVRGEQVPSGTSWLAAAAIGAVVGPALALLVAIGWRRDGGPAVHRLGRRVWRTGRLPAALPSRIAVLRDLERRERDYDRHVPASVPAALWGLLALLNITLRPGLSTVLVWVPLFAAFGANAAVDLADRRRRPRLRALIRRLRDDPTGFGDLPHRTVERSRPESAQDGRSGSHASTSWMRRSQ